jgi:ribosome-binding protein aMBF1 (putative translation factor)
MAARALADKWTDSKLPGYTQHLKAGRIPVTADNAQLLEADKAMQLFKRQQQQQWEKQQAQHERQQQQRQQQNKPRKQQQQAFNRK